MKFRIKPLAALLPLFQLAPSFAEQSAVFDPVVVTATRQATRASELLSDITVIDREQIEQAAQSSLEELLARQPGVQFSSNGGPGTSSNVYIRGANSKHTLVLVDGMRISSATTGETALSRIPLSQIERIEILRGPASSLYGADAIGGVIQIFTKRGEGPTRFNAHTGYGSYRTSDSGVGVSGRAEKLSYSLQAGYYNTDGFSAIRNRGNTSFNPDWDGFRNSNFSGNLAYTLAEGHELGVNALQTNAVSHYDSSGANRNRQFSNIQELNSVAVHARNRLSSFWTSTLRAGHSLDDLSSGADRTTPSIIRTQQDQASWQNDLKLPVGQALLAAEYLKQTVSGTTAFPVRERTIRSLLAGWNGNLDKHRLQFNLRRDDNSQFGEKTTGFAGYGYQFTPEWRAHLSYGTAFRAPSFNELYFPSASPLFVGNPSLKPEFARNSEVGVDWDNGSHRFSAVYFYNRVTDIIVNSPFRNLGQATLEGTTLAYDGRYGVWLAGLSLDLQKSRDDATGKRLPRRADEQLKARLGYGTGAWELGGEWQLVGERFDDTANALRMGGYGLMNLFADYRFEKDWSVFARANNIFDKRYELSKDFATPGANVFVGVRYSPK